MARPQPATNASAHRPMLTSGYWAQSKRPLHILIFLMPLVIAYELGLFFVLRSEEGLITNKAHVTLIELFDAFGIPATSGFYLGGVLIVVILLLWHLLNRDSWRVDGRTIAIMTLETIALTLPLIVLGQLISKTAISASVIASIGPTEQHLAEMTFLAQLTVSIGAGLYEELMFRMLLIAMLHTLMVDLGKLSFNLGAGIAIVVSAAAFTWYHPLEGEAGTLSPQRVAFFFLAGLYFGIVYVARGFGIVVGVHALYDIIMVSMMNLGDDV
ncbi:MAG: CPBP family intramembrane metalloprotease [Phycisphaerales bacterium]|nr:MAG: CPBP family intramembrane metalloprotease [Phycisphaerales bacterium]